MVALNSECNYGSGPAKVGGCGAGTVQETWLKQDLSGARERLHAGVLARAAVLVWPAR